MINISSYKLVDPLLCIWTIVPYNDHHIKFSEVGVVSLYLVLNILISNFVSIIFQDTTYFRYSEESKALSVFTEASLTSAQDSKNFHMVNPGGSLTSQLHCAATCLNSEGQAVFAFATGLGTILLFCMPALDEPGKILKL